MHPVGERRQPASVVGLVAREREPGAEAEREQEGGPEQRVSARQPRKEEQRRDDREAELHHHERLAEARRLGERREVAVQERGERQLESVLGPEQESERPDPQGPDRAHPGDAVEAPLGLRRRLAPQHQQPEAEPAGQEREADEIEPADDVLRSPRPGGAVRLGDRRRGGANAEGEDTAADVAVVGDRRPADRVAPARQPAKGRRDHAGVARQHVRGAGDEAPFRVVDLDPVREHPHALVELEPHLPRRHREALPDLRRGLLERRVGPGRPWEREHDERNDESAPHRCATPALGLRWPKIGATSRDVYSATAIPTTTSA